MANFAPNKRSYTVAPISLGPTFSAGLKVYNYDNPISMGRSLLYEN